MVMLLGTIFVVAFLSVANPVQALKRWVWMQRAHRINLSTKVSYSEIIPGLYLSNTKAATDLSVLYHLNISHVLTIKNDCLPKSTYALTDISNLCITAYDSSRINLKPYFPMTNAFIEEAISGGGNAIVHCSLGVSRSAALVIAYLMQKYKMTFEQAFEYVQSKRFFIDLNPGFVSQLQGYQLQYGVNGYQRFEAYMYVKAGKHKFMISETVIVVSILVPIIILVG